MLQALAFLSIFLGIASPAVAAETVIRIRYATSSAMSLRGTSPLSWSKDTPLVRVAPDLFELRLKGAPAEVKPLLDGAWSLGANFRVTPEGTTELLPRFHTAKGRVVLFEPRFASRILENERPIWVYLPPSYDENPAARFPVLYMHDGQNVFESWLVDDSLDLLFGGDDPPREAIVVGVAHAGDARLSEYTPTPGENGGGRAALYLRFLRTELKPRIDSTFRTLPDAANTGLMGSSLGGLVSVFAAASEPAFWGFAGIVSPSIWWDRRSVLRLIPGLEHAEPRPLRLYVDSGDDGRADTERLATALEAAGYVLGGSLEYVYVAGDRHDEAAWSRRFPAAARFLLGPR